MRTAIFPGSFDPITKGHIDLIRRAAPLFDELIILVAQGGEKEALLSTDDRKTLVEKCLSDLSTIKVECFDGLVADYAVQNKTSVIIRGVRNSTDFNYEQTIAFVNKKIKPDVETLFLFSSPQWSHTSSRAVKDLASRGSVALSHFVEPCVEEALKKCYNQ